MATKTYVQSHLEILRQRRQPQFVWNLFDELPVHEIEMSLFDRIREDWLNRLHFLRCYEDVPEHLVEEFARFLVAHQRTELDNNDRYKCAGSWAIPKDIAMPSDARIDYIYFPTYIAVAVLSLVKQDYPKIAKAIKGFDASLKAGLDFASGRDLQGHGYDSLVEALIAMEYLAIGKVFTLIKNHPDLSRKFVRATHKAVEDIENKLGDNTGWSSIDEKKAEMALKLIEGADADTSVDCENGKSTINKKTNAEIEGEASEEIMLILASELTLKLIDEINDKRYELVAQIESSRPKYAVFQKARIGTCSEEIRMDVEHGLVDSVKSVTIGDFDTAEKLESDKFMSRLKERILKYLKNYFDSRDLDRQYGAGENLRVRVVRCEVMNGDTIKPVIVACLS